MRRVAFAALTWFALGGTTTGQAADSAGDKRFEHVTVKPGDTLWSISQAWLKDPAKWDEILRYNRLPSSDPTVALPGMTLRVPIVLAKKGRRAATLISQARRVEYRRRDPAKWKPAAEEMPLYRGDSLRTFDGATAQVEFDDAQILSLGPESLAIIKPVARDCDVELQGGRVFAGNRRVVTASARITPKTADTEYSVTARSDLSTLVEVYQGAAAVEAQGKTVAVSAGRNAVVPLGLSPGVPKPIADLPAFAARAAESEGEAAAGRARLNAGARVSRAASATAEGVNAPGDMDALGADLKRLAIGQPVSGYHVQASRSRDFSGIIFDKFYSIVFDKSDSAGAVIRLRDEDIPPGVYWWRVAVVDLLGAELPFSEPRPYTYAPADKKSDDLAAPALP